MKNRCPVCISIKPNMLARLEVNNDNIINNTIKKILSKTIQKQQQQQHSSTSDFKAHLSYP